MREVFSENSHLVLVNECALVERSDDRLFTLNFFLANEIEALLAW
jgi:hypothetical protein